MTIAQRCEQCATKGFECTSNYIEQLQSKPRRPRRFRSADDKEKQWSGDEATRVSPTAPRRHSNRSAPGGTTTSVSSDSTGTGPGRGPQMDDGSAMAMMGWITPPSAHPLIYPRNSQRDKVNQQADLLRYLFSPTAVLHNDWRYSDVAALEQARAKTCDLWEERNGAVWDETPSAAHLSLWAAGEVELERVGSDLVETFFQVVHSRFPILEEAKFKARYSDSDSVMRSPLPHALLAVVIAFGARFTEHATFQADREEVSGREAEPGRSRISQLLVIRAREVVEATKAFRVATLANAQTLMILEGLVGQSVMLKKQYRASYLVLAARHLESIREPILYTAPARDANLRTQMAIRMMMSFEGAFFRLPDAAVVDMVPIITGALVSANGDDELWLTAARAGADVCTKLCAELWSPRTAASGIPLNTLRDFVHDHSKWRDLYSSKLRLPVPWPEHWSALTAVKIMSTDILYHALWLVAERAMADFGIQESGGDTMGGMFAFEMQQVRERVKHEAMHSAMRIAMLSALATEQGYLRVDPLVLYRPIYDAGMFLAGQGLEDCLGCSATLISVEQHPSQRACLGSVRVDEDGRWNVFLVFV
ncbi:hypothetical protein CspeluHIS016_0200440 [Cutaneotrichosporon spelunceum]|uniref:Xylanolytic transcriptional activator regulatory domain-containing protein n=1 Tax=Cutaneotrichosporon spelunceum TaxID=1672016 RepID=A0AAD3TQA4_9TREE|nr:hypothetical protein CspeluHIS016_0200440 [Cutaneotrichosporon spelunceum]